MKNLLFGLGLCAATLLGGDVWAKELPAMCNKGAGGNASDIVHHFNGLKKCLTTPNAAKAVEDCSIETFDSTDAAVIARKIVKNCKPMANKFNDCTAARGYNFKILAQEVKQTCPRF